MVVFLTFLRGVLANHAALAAENALLRHQLSVLQRSVKRPRLTRRDRMVWVVARRVLRRWRECLVIVKPATVVGWHRAGFRLFWRWKSRGGRPPVRTNVRALIKRMASENPLWGTPRIQAELSMLGHRIGRATIAKYLGRDRERGPRSSTWRAFIHNHLDCTAAMDFFAVPTITGRVLYVFVILHHARRRVIHFNVTAHPTAEWVVRQLREAFPFDSAPRFLIHDNDSVFGQAVDRCLSAMGITQVRTSLGSPWQNAYAERVIGTMRRECLDHVIVLNEQHLLRLVGDYLNYYHESRCHQALGRDSPNGRTPDLPGDGPIIAEPMVGGLHHRYRRAA
ncbi:MAG: transposase [Phycisphaerales bacterium]|nr:transposase [Phycisphaerales bacterium]